MRSAHGKAWLLVGVLLGSTGCLAAAGAGLGAGIYFSDRGAGSLVTEPIDRVYTAAQAAFDSMDINLVRTHSEAEGDEMERTLEGTLGDRDITVTLKSEGDDTRVEVVAQKSAVTWDKDLASEILKKIVEFSD